MFPVAHRNHESLVKIIKDHVKEKAEIFSDCWSAYFDNRNKKSRLI